MSEGVRLQKFLAEAGVSSRRKAEELITAGRVKVNAKPVTELGTRVDPAKDLVTLDGALVSQRAEKSYYLLYKPPGCVTTASDPQGRPTALEYLRGVKERVFPVGRLDYDAEGAVLCTDDGELANRLAHPRYGHRRVYLAKVRGDPEPGVLERLVAGVRLEDGPARALEAVVHERVEKNAWVRLVVGEGRTHLVKRLCEAVGLQIQRLYRPEFGGVTVEGLRPGTFRPLTPVEVRRMKALVGLDGSGSGDAPAPGATTPAALLPRAARRHGHGPPPPPSEARERTERPQPADRPERPERPGPARAGRTGRPGPEARRREDPPRAEARRDDPREGKRRDGGERRGGGRSDRPAPRSGGRPGGGARPAGRGGPRGR